jgi:flagellar biosynthesis/type III secretory pathway ATPase
MTFVDKCDAVKSVRSVSRTIEGLIDKEKERLTEYCRESQYTRNQGYLSIGQSEGASPALRKAAWNTLQNQKLNQMATKDKSR